MGKSKPRSALTEAQKARVRQMARERYHKMSPEARGKKHGNPDAYKAYLLGKRQKYQPEGRKKKYQQKRKAETEIEIKARKKICREKYQQKRKAETEIEIEARKKIRRERKQQLPLAERRQIYQLAKLKKTPHKAAKLAKSQWHKRNYTPRSALTEAEKVLARQMARERYHKMSPEARGKKHRYPEAYKAYLLENRQKYQQERKAETEIEIEARKTERRQIYQLAKLKKKTHTQTAEQYASRARAKSSKARAKRAEARAKHLDKLGHNNAVVSVT
jgi:hypothetical protein